MTPEVLPAIPDTREVARDLPSSFLYALERAGEISREILDERVREWVAEGWTQRRMAAELGCAQSAIARRCKRLGLHTEAARRGEGRGRSESRRLTTSEDPATWPEPTYDETTETICPKCHGRGRIPIGDA